MEVCLTRGLTGTVLSQCGCLPLSMKTSGSEVTGKLSYIVQLHFASLDPDLSAREGGLRSLRCQADYGPPLSSAL